MWPGWGRLRLPWFAPREASNERMGSIRARNCLVDALAPAHDAAVHMIDTSLSMAPASPANRRQSMGRLQGPSIKRPPIGPRVLLALSAGEAHDNRLASRLLARLKSGCR